VSQAVDDVVPAPWTAVSGIPGEYFGFFDLTVDHGVVPVGDGRRVAAAIAAPGEVASTFDLPPSRGHLPPISSGEDLLMVDARSGRIERVRLPI
jgi:hypothetical protein